MIKTASGFTVLLLLSSILASSFTFTSDLEAKSMDQIKLEPSLLLLGAGARWAGGNGTKALYIDWFDNLIAHPNELVPDPDMYFPTRTCISDMLTQYGFNVDCAGDIPDNLSGYDLLFVDSYWACEPGNEPTIRKFVSEGGGVVLTAGVPCYLAYYCKSMWTGTDLSAIQEWFGAGMYANTGGSASITVDHPFGTQLLEGDIVYVAYTWSHAGVTSLNEDSNLVGEWSTGIDFAFPHEYRDANLVGGWSTGIDFAFTHEYGKGRVYYQAAYRTPGPLMANFEWTPYAITPGAPVTFNASTSRAAWNGTCETPITEYCWDFGDGSTISSTDPVISHTYDLAGWVEVTLTVFDAAGANSSCSQTVLVEMSSFISLSTSASSIFLGFSVGINGTLHDATGNGLKGETVVLSYTFQGAWSWFPISSGTTDDLGQFYVQWMPTATGTFTIEAEWYGNETCRGAFNTVTLSTLPYMNKYVFSVESNSTITALSFNTTSWELRFTATGQEGTTGYARVTVAKSLVENINSIRVYLDKNQIKYATISLDDSWLLTFYYTHSTHEVAVNLNLNAVRIRVVDLDGNGKIDVVDLLIVKAAFGSKLGNRKWDQRADLDKNGLVNIVDVTLVARDFGKTV